MWLELYGESYLPEYSTDAGAMQILNKHGTLKNAVSFYTGKRFKKKLKPGDIALIHIRSLETIGIVLDDERVAVIFEQNGLREITHHFVEGGWSWA